MSFTHLHVHTHYSLLDGACKIPDLVSRVKALGMDSCAITDHGCMFGVVEFFNECKSAGIKPLLGMEAYMAPGDRKLRQAVNGESAYHLLLLARNLAGYRNLIKLSSLAYREGFYYKPRIDKEILREFSEGLICTSACLGGEVCSAFMKRDGKAARSVAQTYLEIFGPDRFFIEVQKQGLKEQDMVNPELVDLADKVGVGLVATNDVHFLNQEDHHAHDVLCCISMGRQVDDESRLKYPTQLYLKSPKEMAEAGSGQNGLARWAEAMENTGRVAAMCDLELDFSRRYAPVYPVPKEKLDETIPIPNAPAPDQMKEDERYLRQLCETGLEWRYGTREVSQEIRKRLAHELNIICMKQFASYFLIVWDFCNYARAHDIPVGARGSGVGTMVGYLLGLCDVDPLKYNLLFERFMDPSRNEMPDIDIDICQDGRQKVIEYVRNKYGHVAQIITFGTLAAKAACKDVGRVLGVPLPEIDKLTKLIPAAPGMTLDKALKQNPELVELYDTDTNAHKVIDLAKRLEGLCRNAGCHAAGVIIADQPLDEIVPLYKDKDDNILTQFEGPVAEKCGLLKMDFLGLRTLTILSKAVQLVKRNKGIAIDLEKLDLTDPKVYELFQRGQTKGIFQFESGGMQDLLMKMRPDRIEDLIAANALYRPGPMELIPSYCARKHGQEEIPKVHPIMDKILEDTYSIMVYQEQVMQIFNQLGEIELANAYKLIKAISKKKTDVIAKFKPQFLQGAMSKGVDKAKAQEIFDLILKFGGYGFNKSHSTRYAMVAFQTAYMKTYHPVEYMAALLSCEMGSTDKVVEYIDECRRVVQPDGTIGIRVLPPDINGSGRDFTPDTVKPEKKGNPTSKIQNPKSESVIRFGLAAVRGVGEKAVGAILEQREAKGEFTSLHDLCERVDLRAVTRSTLEALIKCGAMTSIHENRAALLAALDGAVQSGQQTQDDKKSGQMNMFAALGGSTPAEPAPAPPLPNVKPLENTELLKFEKELLGFYITSHPLTQHQSELNRYTTCGTKEAAGCSEGTEVTIGGMIARVKKTVTKRGKSAGQPMAMITLEDLEGQIDGVLFAETYAEVNEQYPGAVSPEKIVFVKGKIDKRRETPSLIVSELIPVEASVEKLTTGLLIRLDAARHDVKTIPQIKPILNARSGRLPVWIQIALNDGRKASLRLNGGTGVAAQPDLLGDLQQLLGNDAAEWDGPGLRRTRRLQQQELFAGAQAEEMPVEAEMAMEEMEPADDL